MSSQTQSAAEISKQIDWLHTQAAEKHKQGELTTAVDFYQQAINLSQDQPSWIYGNAITLLSQLGQIEEAIVIGELALELHPNADEILRALGVAYEKQNNIEASIDYYRKAVELQQLQPAWVYARIIAYLISQNLLDKAIEIGRLGIELHSDSEWINYHLAEALAAQGNWEEAVTYYNYAIQLKAGLPQLQDKLNYATNQKTRIKKTTSIIASLQQNSSEEQEQIRSNQKTDIFLFPDYRKTNSYQKLLYSYAPDYVSIYSGDLNQALKHLQNYPHRVIFHLHWTSPILSQAKNPLEAERLKNQFIDLLLTFVYEGGCLIWTIHNTLPHNCQFIKQEIELRNAICSIANKIHVHSEKSIPEIEQVFSIPINKIQIIPHGNYLAENQNYINRTVARKKFNFASEDIVYLFFGQIRPYKGIDDLFSAFIKLQQQYHQVHLLVAGNPVHPIKKESIFNRSKIFQNITVIEKHLADSELQWYFNAADIVVCPYKNILTSGSVLNALSFSRPVIAPRVGMIEEIVKDGYNGFLYESNNINDLYNAMSKVVINNPTNQKKLFDQSLKSIEHLTWEKSCLKLISDVYSQIDYLDITIETKSVKCKIWNPLKHKSCLGKVAIIILNYQSIEDTVNLISSLDKSIFHNFNIIVVDNNSPNLTFKNLIDNFEQHTIIQAPENLGYAGGNNIALRYVEDKGFDYVWILNPDTTVEPHSLQELVNAATRHPDISIYGSLICWGHQPNKIWFGGGLIKSTNKELHICHMYDGQDATFIPESIYEVDYVTGASIFCSTKLFKEIGLIPERYFLYFEETDWCLNASQKGHKLAVVPSSKIYHHKRSQVGILPQKYYFYYFIRGSILFMLKYFSTDRELVTTNIYSKFINPWLDKLQTKAPKYFNYFQSLAEKAVEHGLSEVTGKVNLYKIFNSENDYLTSDLEGVIEGALETINETKISGWVWNKYQPLETLEVEIFIDEKKYTKVLANQHREYLELQGYGSGCYGFEINTPSHLFDGNLHTIKAFVDSYKLRSQSDQTCHFKPLSPAYKGRIDGIDQLQVKGWVLDINNLNRILDVEILDGDRIITKTQTNLYRSDLIKANYNTDCGGFCVPIPVQYCDGNKHKLSLRVCGDSKIISTREVLMSTQNYPKLSVDSMDKFWQWLYHYRNISMIHPQNSACIYLQEIEQYRENFVKQYSNQPQPYLVSIIMPAYNRASTIINAIQSVMSQTYNNWELLITDDGSSDNTVKVVKSFIKQNSENRIKLIELKENSGVSKARNESLKKSQGEIIAYLDSDNLWESDFLLIMVNMLIENSWAKIAYCGDKIWQYYPGNTTLKSGLEIVSVRLGHFNKSLIENRNYIDLNVFVHWREVYENLGGFREDMRRLVDWELIVRYTDLYQPKFVPVLLVNYFMGLCNNQITKVEDYSENALKIQSTLSSLGSK